MYGQKRKYEVFTYDVQIYDGWDRRQSEPRKVGETWAVSEGKAIQNMKYRMGLKNSDLECFGRGYYRETCFIAKAV